MSMFFGDKRMGRARLLMAPMTDEEVAALKASHQKALDDATAAHKAELEKLKPKDPPKDDPSLAEKAQKEREEGEKKQKYEKSLEAALNFTIAAKDFCKANDGLIPKNIEGIFAAAEKENFGSAIEKANAIKVGVVSEFFAIQANLDLLTLTQKNELENFLKLTKNVKQERVEEVYSMIFEPTLETLRKIEKAKQVNGGKKDQSSAEKDLADRMMKQSKKHYLGDKE